MFYVVGDSRAVEKRCGEEHACSERIFFRGCAMGMIVDISGLMSSMFCIIAGLLETGKLG